MGGLLDPRAGAIDPFARKGRNSFLDRGIDGSPEYYLPPVRSTAAIPPRSKSSTAAPIQAVKRSPKARQDAYNPRERIPSSLDELDDDEAKLDQANAVHRFLHGEDYSDYRKYKANIIGWREILNDNQRKRLQGYSQEPVITNRTSDRTGPFGLAFDFFTGTGDDSRYFGPGSPFSDEFSRGEGAKELMRKALDRYGNGLRDGDLVDDYGYKFGARRFFGTRNPAEHFVGSWQDGRAYVNGNKIHFTVDNTAGMRSLLYGRPLNEMGLPGFESYERKRKDVRTPFGTFRTPAPGGDIPMRIEWTIPVPKQPSS